MELGHFAAVFLGLVAGVWIGYRWGWVAGHLLATPEPIGKLDRIAKDLRRRTLN